MTRKAPNRPWLMHARPYRLREWLFYRLYSGARAARQTSLYAGAELAFAPGVSLDLRPTCVAHQPIAYTGFYELAVSTRIARLARTGGLMVDVGANYGYFSLLWASLNPHNHVIAFEASPMNQEALIHNVSMNRLSSRIRVEGKALGNTARTMQFDPGPPDQSGWGHLTTEGQGLEVEVHRLDDYCRANGIETIDLLKVDVEGADSWVLEGAGNLLASRRISVLFFEDDGASSRLGIPEGSPERLLSKYGYHVKSISPGEFVATLSG